MTKKRAVIYCRISQDRTGAGLGVARQREDCERLAARLGWEVVQVESDNDTSAYSGKKRQGYAAVLEAIRHGRVDAVLAWHEDRLHRSPRELEDYIEACEPRAIVTRFAQAGELDLTTSSGRLTARIRGAVARQESEHKAERVKRAQLQAARDGRWLGGAPPFGWNIRPDGSATLNRAEAREIQGACKALLAGASLGSIVADLNARNVSTSTGRPWNYTSLRQVLTRPRNAGLSVLNGEVLGRLTWPAIISEDTHRAVVKLLSDPARRRSVTNRAKWLLAGIAVCGKAGCGQPLKSATAARNRSKGTTRTVYRCPAGGGGHVARSANAVDEHVEGVLLGLLSREDFLTVFADGPAPEDTEALRVEAMSLRERQSEAADLFIKGRITGSQLAQISEETQRLLDQVEAALADSTRGSALAQFVGRDPQPVWATLALDRRRAVVRELMTVTVLPSARRGNIYDPELVSIKPRRGPSGA
ncbi:recombinase family protein [Terrabacter sp. MAHUQ-38]|uniref:recombinase family protein n=1 Tax=unclassified Terrabacter TaxID=2630222 RepID=UPI00165E3777|nr:recombinase family protein [Terrabacter sp. MAHUQ-38]MBC9822749.1 recombinase family protein [Terrabacter sp. MAHUQ-38]